MQIVPLLRCSCMNLCISAFSSWVSGSNLPGRVFGAPGSNLIMWSHTVDWGNLWDSALLNTLLCLWYSSGTAVFGSLKVVDQMVTLSRKYWSDILLMGRGAFFVLGVYVAFAAFGANRTIGSCDMSIHPLFQSTLSWKWHGGLLACSCLLIFLPFMSTFPTLWLESSPLPLPYLTYSLIHFSPIL